MTERANVTVIGLGAMGSAMAAVFAGAGHPTTVWNRTAGKAAKLVDAGVVEAASAAEAVAASELIVVSQVDYDAMDHSLAEADLAGKVVVNLSSDSPERLRVAARWVTERGGTLVTGGIMSPPPGIGQPGSYVYYSGPKEALDAHRSTLEVLGGVDYVGSDPGLAMLYYQAMLTVFWTTLASYMYSVALVGTAGVRASDLLPDVKGLLDSLTAEGAMGFLNELTSELESGRYPGEFNNLHMQAVGARHIVDSFRQAGLDTTLPGALAEVFRRTDEAGHGADGLGSVIETIRGG